MVGVSMRLLRRRSAGVVLCCILAAIGAAAGCRPGEPVAKTNAPQPEVQFVEIAEQVGLRYQWGPRGKTPITNLEAFGAGCGFADINDDGLMDVVAVGEPGIRLYLQLAGNRFEDVSEPFGLAPHRGPWMGVAVGDYDADGWQDLLVTGFRCLRLLRNEGGRRLTDVTAAAGLSPTNWKRWGASAGFADLDRDGDQDMVLVNYVYLGPDAKKYCELAPGVISGCPPADYEPEYTRVYRNAKDRFVDVTIASGCNTTHGKGLVLAFCDYDSDGKQDFYLGNDGTPSDLARGLGGFRFRNVGIEAGAAFGVTGQPTAAMGADWGDYDRDGDFDLVSTAFSDEKYTLHRQLDGMFVPVSDEVGIGLPTFKPLGFGAKFLDADNDGWLDIHFVNGHVFDNVQLIDPGSTYHQPMMLFMNRQQGPFVDIAATAGPGFAAPIVGRGSAVGDYDNDGRQDLMVVDFEGRLRLYRNQTENGNRWLRLDLRGGQRGNRHAYGARVEVRQGSERQLRQVAPASSYLSTSDPRLHFGLGTSDNVDLIRVVWPSGRVQEATKIRADRAYRWKEGEQPQEYTAAAAP